MRMTEFTNAVTVCSGLGSILALVLLLARPCLLYTSDAADE